MGMVRGSGCRLATGVFVPTGEHQRITVAHNLGKVPCIFWCEVEDRGISSTTTQTISYYGCTYNNGTQFLYRSRNNNKFDMLAGVAENNMSSPTETDVIFGGSSGVTHSWAVGYTYTWYALYFED